MKKLISVLLVLLLSACMLTGCGNKSDNKNGKLSVVATIFPEYDWVINILGEKADEADVTLLLDNGVDLHSFQPTTDDIIKISRCDLFVYVGGESDEWVEDVLKSAANKNMITINLLDVLKDSIKEEELKDGMQVDNDDSEEDDETEYDEHVWLSLKNACVIVTAISDALGRLDGNNAAVYSANASNYIGKLNALDARYQATVNAASKSTLLFGDRFPFRYLVDDYGLDYYAAFAGCSAESEASFKTVTFLANKVDELNLATVLTLEGTNHRIAESIVSASKSKSTQILSINSMQSVTAVDISNGASYISIAKKNLDVLSNALN